MSLARAARPLLSLALRIRLGAPLGVALGAFSGQLHAAEDANALFLKEKVEALYQEGAALYQAGRHREALPKFEAAQALFPDPSLLYNIGRCHEALGEIAVAEARYDAILADEAAPAELRAKVEARKVAIAEARAAAMLAPVPTPPPPARDDTLPWALIGASAVALAAGTVFITLGVADHTELERSEAGQGPEISDKKARELDEGGTTKKTAGGTLVGLGVTAAAVGIYLLLDEDEGPSAHLAPTLNGLGLVGRF